MKKKVIYLLVLIVVCNMSIVLPITQKQIMSSSTIASAVIPEVIETEEPIIEKVVINPGKTIINKVKQPKVDVAGIAEIKNKANVKWLNLMNIQINKLPENVLNRFQKEGWHIYVTTENIAKTQFGGKYKSVEGVTDYASKQILIEDRAKAINESVIHEFGHFIDYYSKFESSSEEFKKIYEEEVETFKKNISNPGCVTNTKEFFAETIYYMYTNPSKCTPKAKAFALRVIQNI